ncbi:MAG: hypothetical protein H7Y17_14755, partial [Chlorobia bacterium]|nr:hypothetical protein [Fimbriimonadaceae bacterium]
MALTKLLLCCAIAASSVAIYAAKLVEVRTVDDEYLMIHWQDGWVHYNDKAEGPKAYNHPEGVGGDCLEKFGNPLDTAVAADVASYSISSDTDSNYKTPLRPIRCSRKSKVSGTAWNWPNPDWTLEHTIYLNLPHKLKQGGKYRITISPMTNSDATEKAITFDIFKNVS